ncbi:L-serine ammonia-lyase, iron-sulfur-dependent subunit beta [Pseudothermotoga thermarum]|uniref:L-serine dehydratase n=1 Tax=Pseudothermotoga thermarum DSM 5069 TaxID=688269 RepID=F7YWF8_9THEM|nr:L-serine ammonia-lyase, iron-sulfur-dependent subunit beta [Pseudothermotoga thermarum]AEH51936.1 L-serine ammonia-lyase [Pseudothermotoga thermarum DSM 5069]
MKLTEILGPVMIGPSSSHTLGAMRIARFVNKLLGYIPKKVEFILHGSFAKTGFGHGTDKALAAGMLGMNYDDERVKDAITIAKERGFDFRFFKKDLGDVHPNTVLIKVLDTAQEIEGCSVGGGAIRITRINGVKCDISWEYDTLVILNKDKPGVLSRITTLIKANIANLYLRRISFLEEKALTIIELDGSVDISELKKLDCVLECYFVPRDDFM